ncbi:hypothetical protein [Streptacidiphilus cavernicola]|uniref:Uncharacterized protein n=1 Tax=Streptacidiphilus cavernicola TaxID=3342716 RepID=A0ABV6VSC8_9ACTN
MTAPAPAVTGMTSRPAPAGAPAGAPRPAAEGGQGGFVRLLGVILALLVTDPVTWTSRTLPGLVLTVAVAVLAWFGASPLTARPVALGFRWRVRLLRHRNTAFAVLCVLVAATERPPGWLAGCDAALLLSYLLLVDAVAGGPPAARLLRRPVALVCAYGGSGVVLAAALVPVAPAGPWVRLLAAAALAAAAAAVMTALAARRTRR